MITAKQVTDNFFIIKCGDEKIGNLTVNGSSYTFSTRDNVPIYTVESLDDTIEFVKTNNNTKQLSNFDPVLKVELFKKDNREYYYAKGTFKIFYSYKEAEIVVDPKQKTLHRHKHIKL